MIARMMLLVAGLGGLALAGCVANSLDYLTEERTGNITVVFINNTSARAVFSFGSYDALDRDPPGAATLQQTRLEGLNTSQTFTIPCRRNVAIGTDDFVERVVLTNGDAVAGFDADAFNADVSFSTAPATSEAAGLPTAGTARGREVRLGVDFKCGDQLFFTYEVDANAPGGFRIDFAVLPAEPEPN